MSKPETIPDMIRKAADQDKPSESALMLTRDQARWVLNAVMICANSKRSSAHRRSDRRDAYLLSGGDDANVIESFEEAIREAVAEAEAYQYLAGKLSGREG